MKYPNLAVDGHDLVADQQLVGIAEREIGRAGRSPTFRAAIRIQNEGAPTRTPPNFHTQTLALDHIAAAVRSHAFNYDHLRIGLLQETRQAFLQLRRCPLRVTISEEVARVGSAGTFG